jgi:hypothetical protein
LRACTRYEWNARAFGLLLALWDRALTVGPVVMHV